MVDKEKLRIDKYLWAIRIFKTRRLATDACSSNKVKQEGSNVKASKPVNVGDRYEIRTPNKNWIIEVSSLLPSRVAFSEAIKHYNDLTPEENIIKKEAGSFVFDTGKRQSKQGRPTKKKQKKVG